MDVFSITDLIVKEHSTGGSTSTPFDAAATCVEQHSGYIVDAPTTKEGLTGQGAAKLTTASGPQGSHLPPELAAGSCLVSSWFKILCHLQACTKQSPRPTCPEVMDERRTPVSNCSTSSRSSVERTR